MSKAGNITPPTREAGTKTLCKPLMRPTPDGRMMDTHQYSAHSILVRAVAAGMLAAGALIVAFQFADAQSTPAPVAITLAVHAAELVPASDLTRQAQPSGLHRGD